MKTAFFFSLTFAFAAALLAGCTGRPTEPRKGADQAPSPVAKTDTDASVRANIEKLGAEDRKLAAAQGYCAVETKNPLGSMGVPFKVMVKDQPVFLCCDGCETLAKAHPDRTLARVEQLKEKRASEGK